MSIVATEMWSLRSYAKGGSATRGWNVVGATTELEAISASGLPVVGDKYPADNNLAIPKGGIVAESPGFSLWIVRANYQVGSFDDQSDKTNERPRYLWQPGNVTEATDVDPDGNTIANSAGDPIDTTTDLGTMFLTVTKWRTNYDVAQAILYQNTYNSDTVTLPLGVGTVAPGQMRCLMIMPNGEYDATATSIPIHFYFEIRRGSKQDGDGVWDAFKHRLLDAGRRGWYDSSGLKQGEFFSAGGQSQVSADVPLDGTGKPYSSSWGIVIDKIQTPVSYQTINPNLLEDTGNAVFLKFKKLRGLPFSALNVF